MRSPLFRSKQHKDEVYTAMVEAIGCGPFDGGCVSFAMALQKVYGGEVHVICGQQGADISGKPGCNGPQHAVLRRPDGRFMDFGAIGTADHMIHVFTTEECPRGLHRAFIRPIEPDDLDEAPRDAALIERLATLLANPPAQQPRKVTKKRKP